VIKKSLSPATVISVDVNEEDGEVIAYIPE